MLPVMSARLLMAFAVSVPFVLWFTPIVQPMNAGPARDRAAGPQPQRQAEDRLHDR